MHGHRSGFVNNYGKGEGNYHQVITRLMMILKKSLNLLKIVQSCYVFTASLLKGPNRPQLASCCPQLR